ncbi:MAG: GNAT family N-acetyltransferase [Rhodospirillales bacterium]|nr:GNAT family N-acetyltransferase [Rhodospirillales bacterium]MBI2585043.1 GNAT family N-acetyltransferase [Rhodospirillales bacterium]
MDIDFQLQPFETDLLGVPVGRLALSSDDTAAIAGLDSLIAGWLAAGVWLVSCRVPEGSAVIPALGKGCFRVVETLVTFRRTLHPRPMPKGVEFAEAGDAAACVAIAGRAFANDRLHRDPQVSGTVADRIRERWVLNDLGGRADACFVVRDGGQAVGFNLCLLDGEEAVIDLIAVDIRQQNKGLGRRLVEAALAHYGGRGRTIRVGTQADNAPSIALYRGAGFVEADRRITLHWVNPNAASALKDDFR